MRLLLVFLLATVCLGCTQDKSPDSLAPQVFRISVLPDQSSSRLLARYSPLIEYLKKETALNIELVLSKDYSEMLDEFDAGRLHLVNFGGLTFVQAERRSLAVPLVMRDTDLNFASCFFVKASDSGESITEFKGEVFTFGPKLSTSGHLMPRRLLASLSVNPEQFFSSVQYSSGHDESVTLVSNGSVRIGAANCVIVQTLIRENKLKGEAVRVIATTPVYPDYVWAAQESTNAKVKLSITNAFMELDMIDAEHAAILQKLGASGYVPAGRADFEDIRLAAEEVGMLDVVNTD